SWARWGPHPDGTRTSPLSPEEGSAPARGGAVAGGPLPPEQAAPLSGELLGLPDETVRSRAQGAGQGRNGIERRGPLPTLEDRDVRPMKPRPGGERFLAESRTFTQGTKGAKPPDLMREGLQPAWRESKA